MAKTPYLPLYYNDLRGATQDWTDEEFGAYVRLLIYQWDKGAIPKDMERLKKVADSLATSWLILANKFVEKRKGFLVNPVMENIRNERDKFSKKQSENGKKRWKKQAGVESQPIAKSQPDFSQTLAKPEANGAAKTMPSSSSSKKEKYIKEIPEKQEEQIKVPDPINAETWPSEKQNFLAFGQVDELFMREKKISKEVLMECKRLFIVERELSQDYKTTKELRRYFLNWFNLQVEKKPGFLQGLTEGGTHSHLMIANNYQQ